MNNNNLLDNRDFYTFKSNSTNINIAIMFLLAIVISIIPILLSSSSSILFETSLSFYFTVVILFGLMIYYGYWGILIGFFSFWICGYVLELSFKLLLVNSFINIFQLFIIYIVFKFIKKLKINNPNMYVKGSFYLSFYNFILITTVSLYLPLSIIYPESTIFILIVFSSLIFIATIIKSYINRDLSLLIYTVFIATIPSLSCSYISAIISHVPKNDIIYYTAQWTLSNYILLQTIGYYIFQLLFVKSSYKNHIFTGKLINIRVNTTIYFIAQLLWNILVINVYISNKENCESYIFILPWLLGNALFGSNLYFSIKTDKIPEDEKFKWYENRVIVVEQNTKVIITIIALLFPISTALLSDISNELLLIFAANIFCACLSVGLVWVPSNSVKFITLLQTLKTTFFLFSISLLLLSSILVIFLR